MKKAYVILIVSVLCAAFIPIQLKAGWTRSYGGNSTAEAFHVEETQDGFIVTGKPWPLFKVNSIGDSLCAMKYDTLTIGYCIHETSDGGYVIAGQKKGDWFTSSFAFLKLDENGNLVWSHNGSDGGQGYAGWVSETSDDGYIVTGSPWALFRVNEWGDTLWTRQYPIETYCVEQTSDGGYILTGRPWDTETCRTLMKTDPLGNEVWSSSDTSLDSCCGYFVQENPDNSFTVTGRKAGNIWLAEISSTGSLDWSFEYAPGEGRSFCRTGDGGYLITGRTSYNEKYCLIILKVDGEGELLWSKTYETDIGCAGRSIQKIPEGGFIVAGYIIKPDTLNDPWQDSWSNVWLLRIDSLGDTLNAAILAPPIPVTSVTQFEVMNPVGREITLLVHEAGSLDLIVLDALGRKVDELHSARTQGTIRWGGGRGCYGCFRPGVYFIRVDGELSETRKVVLIR